MSTSKSLPKSSAAFSAMISIHADDVDRLGHTNNVRYLEWMEQIAWQHIESLGYGWDAMDAAGLAFAIIETQIQYQQATFEGDELRLETWISFNDGRFKCGRAFRLVRLADEKTILTAQMTFACIRLPSGKPAKMSPEMISALNAGIAVPE